jgi:hypothetical protein
VIWHRVRGTLQIYVVVDGYVRLQGGPLYGSHLTRVDTKGESQWVRQDLRKDMAWNAPHTVHVEYAAITGDACVAEAVAAVERPFGGGVSDGVLAGPRPAEAGAPRRRGAAEPVRQSPPQLPSRVPARLRRAGSLPGDGPADRHQRAGPVAGADERSLRGRAGRPLGAEGGGRLRPPALRRPTPWKARSPIRNSPTGCRRKCHRCWILPRRRPPRSGPMGSKPTTSRPPNPFPTARGSAEARFRIEILVAELLQGPHPCPGTMPAACSRGNHSHPATAATILR